MPLSHCIWKRIHLTTRKGFSFTGNLHSFILRWWAGNESLTFFLLRGIYRLRLQVKAEIKPLNQRQWIDWIGHRWANFFAGTSLCHVMSWQASPNVNLDQREVVSLDLTGTSYTYTTKWALEEAGIANFFNIYQHSLHASFLASMRANWAMKMRQKPRSLGWIWCPPWFLGSQDPPGLQLPHF